MEPGTTRTSSRSMPRRSDRLRRETIRPPERQGACSVRVDPRRCTRPSAGTTASSPNSAPAPRQPPPGWPSSDSPAITSADAEEELLAALSPTPLSATPSASCPPKAPLVHAATYSTSSGGALSFDEHAPLQQHPSPHPHRRLNSSGVPATPPLTTRRRRHRWRRLQLDGATTGVTLVHRVTGDRHSPHAELANIVPVRSQRSPRLLDHVPTHVCMRRH